MLWSQLKPEHHLKRATVSAKSTPDSPVTGSGPFTGVIRLEFEHAMPCLLIGDEVHCFADWWTVELLADQ